MGVHDGMGSVVVLRWVTSLADSDKEVLFGTKCWAVFCFVKPAIDSLLFTTWPLEFIEGGVKTGANVESNIPSLWHNSAVVYPIAKNKPNFVASISCDVRHVGRDTWGEIDGEDTIIMPCAGDVKVVCSCSRLWLGKIAARSALETFDWYSAIVVVGGPYSRPPLWSGCCSIGDKSMIKLYRYAIARKHEHDAS